MVMRFPLRIFDGNDASEFWNSFQWMGVPGVPQGHNSHPSHVLLGEEWSSVHPCERCVLGSLHVCSWFCSSGFQRRARGRHGDRCWPSRSNLFSMALISLSLVVGNSVGGVEHGIFPKFHGSRGEVSQVTAGLTSAMFMMLFLSVAPHESSSSRQNRFTELVVLFSAHTRKPFCR